MSKNRNSGLPARPSQQQQGLVAAGQLSVQHSYSPLPPASELAAMEQVLPGAADRLIKMAEGQATHRQAQESKMVDGACRDSRIGMWMGFGVALAGLATAAYAMALNHPVAGSVVGSVDLVALVSVFVSKARGGKPPQP